MKFTLRVKCERLCKLKCIRGGIHSFIIKVYYCRRYGIVTLICCCSLNHSTSHKIMLRIKEMHNKMPLWIVKWHIHAYSWSIAYPSHLARKYCQSSHQTTAKQTLQNSFLAFTSTGDKQIRRRFSRTLRTVLIVQRISIIKKRGCCLSVGVISQWLLSLGSS